MSLARLSRRLWLRAAPLTGLWYLLPGRTAAADAQPVAQPAAAGETAFLRRAIEMRQRAEANGDQPYGAVVARDGQIIGEAPSAVVTAGDPTAHAEMEAIRNAARRFGGFSLRGATLYSSSRPCPMCEAAAYWAGIGRMVHGPEPTDVGAPRLSRC